LTVKAEFFLHKCQNKFKTVTTGTHVVHTHLLRVS